jgi:hypothetical protein
MRPGPALGWKERSRGEQRLPDRSSIAPCSRRPGRCAPARGAGAAARPPGPRNPGEEWLLFVRESATQIGQFPVNLGVDVITHCTRLRNAIWRVNWLNAQDRNARQRSFWIRYEEDTALEFSILGSGLPDIMDRLAKISGTTVALPKPLPSVEAKGPTP